MMAKDPAVLFYTADFLTGTMTMSNEQKGKYITLLCLQHQKTTLTEKDMLNICDTYDKDIFSKFKQDGDDFYNERMRLEHEKRSKYSKSRSENRKKNENNICKSYDKHMENENEDYNTNNLSNASISLNSKKNKLENENKKRNQPLGENSTQGEDLSPFAIQPARPLSDFIGQISAEGKVIG